MMDSRSGRGGRGRGGRGRGGGGRGGRGRGRGRGVKRPRFEDRSGDGDNNNNNNTNWSRRRRHTNPRDETDSKAPPTTSLSALSSSPSQPLKCSVCQQAEQPKYKCPKCREPYCSISCCQQHKLSCSAQQQQPLEAESNTQQAQFHDDVFQPLLHSKYLPPDLMQNVVGEKASNSISHEAYAHRRHGDEQHDDDDEDLEDDWKITDAMKETLNHCDWIKRELQDPGLRQLITQTAAASRIVQHNGKTEQENSLESIKATNPMFATFCDKMLVVTGILERQEEGKERDLEDWLNRGPNELGQLVLKPIPRQRPRPMDVDKADKSVENEESSSAESSSEESSDSSSDSSDSG